MTRPVYTDLLLTFTPGTSTNPSSTQAANLITELFKQGFIERNETYTTDTDTVLDTEAAYAIIKAEASRLITQWANSLRRDSSVQSPVLYLSKDAIIKLKQLTKQKLTTTRSIVTNIGTMGDPNDY